MSLGLVGVPAVLLLGVVLLLHYRNRFAVQSVPRAQTMNCDADESAPGPMADGGREISRMSSIIVSTLAAQKAFVSLGKHGPASLGSDNFSIGYVGGYVETILNRKGIKSLQACQTVAEIVFSAMFVGVDGFDLYKRYLSLQEDGDADVFAGINVATGDVVAWLGDNSRVPTGWSDHVHGKPHG